MGYAKKITSVLLLLIISFSISAQQYSKITYIHTDPDGTPFAATDEEGELEWKTEHYPFGQEYETPGAGDRSSDISFAGKPYDEEIGLSYFGSRWYDPQAGRFTSIDPMPVIPSDFKSFNRYAYGFNNPYKYVDPDGNLAFLIPVAIWAGNALTVAGAGASGYAVGTSGYDLYSGRKTAGEAAKSAAI
jgi:RHS repeat-associated protein